MEFPDFEKSLWQRYKDKGLQVIGISGYTSREKLIDLFIKQTGVTFPIASGFKAFGPLISPKDSRGVHNLKMTNAQRPDIAPFEVHGTEDLTPFPFHLLVGPDGKILFASKTYDLPKVISLMEQFIEDQ